MVRVFPNGYSQKNSGGFVAIEIILFIIIIAIVGAIVVIAVSPSKKIAEGRNAQRLSDINSMAASIKKYSTENKDIFPSAITESQKEICVTGGNCDGLVNLSVITKDEKYLAIIPKDPTGSSENGAGYEIKKSANGRVTIVAPDAELGETISVTK